MKVIKPITVTNSMLVSSTLPEDDYPPYDPLIDYTVGNRVVYQHQIYECVETPNIGHTPGVSPQYWAAIEPTNRWLMFDQEVGTQSVADGQMTVVVTPGYFNSIALLGIDGTSLHIEVRNGAGGDVVYERTVALDAAIITNWYEYFFEPKDLRVQTIFTGIPPYGLAYVTVTISGERTKCGSLIFGSAYDIGGTRYGASVGIIDFSRKETSAAGVASLNKRKFSRRCSAPLMLENFVLSKVYKILSDLRATPCVWIGSDDPTFEPLVVFGFYRDFSIDIEYATTSYCSLEIEGLT